MIASSSRAGFNGIEYDTDYSANYTTRSLVDKGYTDSVYWKTSGTTTLTGANTITTSSTNTLIFNTTNTADVAMLSPIQGTIGISANTPLISFRSSSSRVVADGYVDTYLGTNNSNVSSTAGGNVGIGNNNLSSITPSGTFSGSPYWSTFRGDRNVAIGFGNGASLLGSGGSQATAGMQLSANSLTSGNAFDISSSSITTGALAKLTSTSTVINNIAGTNGLFQISSSGANSTASKTAIGMSSIVTNTGTTNTNIGGYFSASGATNNHGLIVNAGNVGIGDTTPDNLLEVLSSSAALTQLTISNTNAGDYDTQLGFELADGTNIFTLGVDDSDGDKFKISTSALGTNDAIIVDSGGKVSLGNLTVALSSQDALCIVNGGTEVQRNNGAQTCTVSSFRFKNNIVPIEESVLETLSKFAPSTFIYNGQDNERIGLIAEQVVQIEPRLVFFESDGVTPRGVRYEDLSVLTLKGIQELSIKINSIGDLSVENTWRNALVSWFANVENGIGSIFAQKVDTKELETEKLCIKDDTESVCITKDQLKDLLNNSSASISPIVTETIIETVDTPTETIETSPLEESPIIEEGTSVTE